MKSFSFWQRWLFIFSLIVVVFGLGMALLGLSLWYVIDTVISLCFSVVFNAVFNTAIFILAMLPLLFTRREFQKS